MYRILKLLPIIFAGILILPLSISSSDNWQTLPGDVFLQRVENGKANNRSKIIPSDILFHAHFKLNVTNDISLRAHITRPLHLEGQLKPVLIFLHGGGWRRGTSVQNVPAAAYFTLTQSYIGISLDYRLSDIAPFPAAIEDVKYSIRWIRSKADDWNVDTNKICLIGGSAGGHLTAFTAATNDQPEFDGYLGLPDFSSKVNAAVVLNAPVDFTGHFPQREKSKQNLIHFLGGTYEEVPERYQLASPITHIDSEMPPLLIMHGQQDEVIPPSQAELFYNKLQILGVESYLHLIPDAGHGWFNTGMHFPNTLNIIKQFLKTDLKW